MKLSRDKWIRYLFIVSFILLATIPPLNYIHGFLSADESYYMFIGDSINHGSILYKDFIVNYPPGIFYLNAIIFFISGKSFYASRIILYVIIVLSALIIYFLGKDQWNEYIGQLSSILFLIGVYNPLVEGYFVLTEQYMVFFGLLGILIFLKFHDWRYLVPVGFFFGIATLFKQPGGLFLILFFLYYLLGLLNEENRTRIFLCGIIKSSLLISIGFIIPIFITMAFFYREGILYDFLSLSFVYYLSGRYERLFEVTSLSNIFYSLVIIWIPALISVTIIIYDFIIKKIWNNNLLVACWFLLFGCTLIIRQYGHYFIQILPPACILASITLTKLMFLINNTKSGLLKKSVVKILIFIFLLWIAFQTVFYGYEQLIGSDRNQLLENQLGVSNFIAVHTEPTQRIISLPYDPSIYFLSGRYPCVNYLYLGDDITEESLIYEINRSDVPYVIIKGHWLPEKLNQFLTKNYAKQNTLGIYKIFSRSS